MMMTWWVSQLSGGMFQLSVDNDDLKECFSYVFMMMTWWVSLLSVYDGLGYV